MKIIYRCGWCGLPTNKEGQPLKVNPDKYLERFKDKKQKLVQGHCCPNGNEEVQMVRVSREMALDAGMPEIEGTLIPW